VDVDAQEWNTSLDYSGGGLVSSAADLDRFYRGLFTGELIEDPSILFDPAYWVESGNESMVQGIGFTVTVDPGTEQVIAFEHGGFWGSYMSFFPAQETCVVFTANQVQFTDIPTVLGSVYSVFAQ